MKRIFLINPVAGPKDPSAWLLPRIRAAAARCADEVEVVTTTHPGHARQVAQQYAQSGQPAWLYACGGDGTFNEVVQAAAGCGHLAVGLVPCGSGNDFVRNFGPREAFLDLDAQLAAAPRRIDTIRTEYGHSAAICAAGLDAQVAYGIPKFKRLPFCGGSMAYTLSVVEAFFSPLGHRLRVTLDGHSQEGEYMMLAICNGRVYGGGYTAGPQALLDDGLLDVVLFRPVPRWKMAGLLARYKTGGHLGADGAVTAPFAPYMSFRRVHTAAVQVLDGRPLIVTLDGECAPRTELHAEVQPQNLSILLPATLRGRPMPFV